jgi:hypothetical protein
MSTEILIREMLILPLAFAGFAFSSSLSAQGWEHIGMGNRESEKIAIHPDEPTTVFVVSGTKIYRNSGDGTGFQVVYVNPRGYDFTDVSISPLDPNYIFAADEGDVFGEYAHVHLSLDKGESWNEHDFPYPSIADIEPDRFSLIDFYVTTRFGLYGNEDLIEENGGDDLEIHPLDSQFLVLGVGGPIGIGVSTDAGNSWSYYNAGLPDDLNTRILSISLHPNDPSTMIVGSCVGVTHFEYQVFISTDSGHTFTDMGWDVATLNDILIDPTIGTGGNAFIASDEGVRRLQLDLLRWSDLNGGLEGDALRVHDLAAIFGTALLAGTGDGLWLTRYLPDLSLAARKVDDTASGNGNGSAEPGEQAALSVYLFNDLFKTEGLTGVLETVDANITIEKAEAVFPDIEAISVGSNTLDPFIVSIRPEAEYGHLADFSLRLASSLGDYLDTLSFSLEIGGHVVLLVDDDEGEDYEKYYMATLDTLDVMYEHSILYDRWDVDQYGSAEGLLPAPLTHTPVIWYTGDATESTLTLSDQNAVTVFLDEGGSLLLTGQNIAEDLAGTSFLRNELGIDWKNLASDAILNGLSDDPMSGFMTQILSQGTMGANNQRSRDELRIIQPSLATVSIVYDTTTLAHAGVRIEREGGKCVFLGFGFEAVNNSNSPAFITRVEMMRDMLLWLAAPEVSTELIPDEEPVIVPPGGSFGMAASVVDTRTVPLQTDVWFGAYRGSTYVHRMLFRDMELLPRERIEVHLTQNVPEEAPPGDYVFVEFCGDYDTWAVTDSSYFKVTVTGAE